MKPLAIAFREVIEAADPSQYGMTTKNNILIKLCDWGRKACDELEQLQARIVELETEKELAESLLLSGNCEREARVLELEAEVEKCRWIPKEERFPKKKDGKVLAKDSDGYIWTTSAPVLMKFVSWKSIN